jgi:hypothetical protein
MKTFFLLLIILPSLFSCDKNNEEVGNASMTAIVNGKSWASGLVDGSPAVQAIQNTAGMDIGGFEPSSSSSLALFVLVAKDKLAGKTLKITEFDLAKIDDDECYASYLKLDKDGNVLKTYYALSGSLSITTVSATNIKGTFSFEGSNEDNAADKISVKNGKFDVPIN